MWHRIVTIAVNRRVRNVGDLFDPESLADLLNLDGPDPDFTRPEDDGRKPEPVTGLPGYRATLDMLADAVERAAEAAGEFPVIILSIDRLAVLNQVMGRNAGDASLRQLGERLARLSDLGFAGYVAANRFAFIGRHDLAAELREDLLKRVMATTDEPFSLGTSRHRVGVSSGVALFPEHASDANSLLQAANFARRCAVTECGGQTVVCDLAKCVEQREKFTLEDELRDAIGAGQLCLYYQPKVRIPERRLVGFEALVRWQHPRRGLLGPGVFLDIAEEANLIPALTNWAFRTVAKQTRAWIQQGFVPVPIAINTPPSEFVNGILTEHLPAYEAFCLPAGLLEIEITESKMIDDIQQFCEVAETLKARGLKLAMDDFGTGYSCLSGLSKLPITTLKVDQSFTRNILKDPGSRAIAAAVVSIGQELGLELVAEGVENIRQLQVLRSLGCNIVQGYLTGRPAPAEEAAKLLARAPIRKPVGADRRSVVPVS